MTRGPRRNIAASVRQRLLDIAREQGEEFNLLLIRYGIERLLYRIYRSDYADQFVLKGALLFYLWAETPHRPTRDVDLEGQGSPDPERFRVMFREICLLDVEDDGLVFDVDSFHAANIKEQDRYLGTRIKLRARLGSARINLQVDVGFGDAITPEPKEHLIPVILDHPAPVLRIYPWETVVAEKYQALVELGMANSRVKDIFDLHFLAKHFSFKGRSLATAIEATFARRNTLLPASCPVALGEEYTSDRISLSRWSAFLQRSRLADQSLELRTVADGIWKFLGPVTEAIQARKPAPQKWEDGGPWQHQP